MGKWIVQNHSIPREDALTYTAKGHPYIDIHWLYQTLLYGLYQAGGYAALTLFGVGLFTLLFFLFLKRLQVASSLEGSWPFFLLLLALGLEHRFSLRPEILSWVLLTATLWILDSHQRGKVEWLKCLPVLYLLWANVHGLFVTGWAALAAYLLGDWVRARRLNPSLWLWSGASVLATLVNPYFIKGSLYPFITQVSLWDPFYRNTIGELFQPWSAGVRAQYPGWPWFYGVYQAVFLFSLLAAVLLHKRVKAHEWVLLGIFGVLSVAAVRNMYLFLLVALPILARLLSLPRWGENKWRAWLLRSFLGLFLAVTCLRVIHGSYYLANDGAAEFGLGISENYLPVKAAAFLKDNHLGERMINADNQGGWLEWEGLTPSIDGRLEVMGKEFYSEYVGALGRFGRLTALAEKYQAPVIIYDHISMPITALQQVLGAKWRMAYFDENAAVFLAPGYRVDLPDADPAETLARRGLGQIGMEVENKRMKATPESWIGWFWKGLWRDQEDPAKYFYLGDFNFYSGHPDLAERCYLEGVQATGGRDTSFWRALYRNCVVTGQTEKAQWCLTKIGASAQE